LDHLRPSNLSGSLPIRWGCSISAFGGQTAIKKHIMKAALKRGVETGTLVMIKSSYKVSSDAKKPLKKAAAPKVAKAVVAKVRMCCIL
jgi:hypothetical protein